MIAPQDIPVVPRGVRVHWDRVREGWVLLGPERAITLDPVAHAIMSEIDGHRSLGEIVELLAAKYEAPPEQIATDSAGFLNALLNRRFLEIAS
ncbi:pyrroloquinoline quinone biosynthesis peptide chaperone PqqD [Profundibacterium mesophilum]|uniref:Pyrroloquinoline quinone synthesis protein D n=1 Tax=Profundibacterium mesophilum KAUST100406-0324 TaxID=1037889 RepID=A0A921NPS5_9RHOB|nr:pyrroloquinoline quinone biosynthesis peptide chaperone PqqD [Profundibacterium mesophilum]KAF0674687.1 putative pyrroloquinoline quinone synthesis protein D [Profundibacterium mesophilum KAUST100406-0324]